MANEIGNAPELGHCVNKTTLEKLCGHLDTARELGIEVVGFTCVGGRDWVIVTYGTYIPGLAGRRVFT